MGIWRNKRYLCTRNKRKTPLEADKNGSYEVSTEKKSYRKIWRLRKFDLPLQSQTKNKALIVWRKVLKNEVFKNLSKRFGDYKFLIYLCNPKRKTNVDCLSDKVLKKSFQKIFQKDLAVTKIWFTFASAFPLERGWLKHTEFEFVLCIYYTEQRSLK